MTFKQKLGYTTLGATILFAGMLTANLLSPITAQITPQDATFGKLTCTGLDIVDSKGHTVIKLEVDYQGAQSADTGGFGRMFIGSYFELERIKLQGDLLDPNITCPSLDIVDYEGQPKVKLRGLPFANITCSSLKVVDSNDHYKIELESKSFGDTHGFAAIRIGDMHSRAHSSIRLFAGTSGPDTRSAWCIIQGVEGEPIELVK